MKAENSRYEILAKKLTKDQNASHSRSQTERYRHQETNYRTYPQGQLAAQVLGFVNDEGEGQYGLEQALNTAAKRHAWRAKSHY